MDYKYILKRVLVGVLIGVILMSIKRCDVYALSVTSTPTTCYGYYGTGNNNQSGTVTSYNHGGNLMVYKCSVSTARRYMTTRFDYTVNHTAGSGYGDYIFGIYTDSQAVSTVRIVTGGLYYYCDLNTGMYGSVQSMDGFTGYTATCHNVPINNGRQFVVSITWYYNGPTDDNIPLAYISRDINYTVTDNSALASSIASSTTQSHNDSVAIQNAINQQRQESQQQATQAHNDAVATQNKIDGVKDAITSDTVDTTQSNSFFSNFNTTDNGGISGVITSPLRFINKLSDTCSPVNLNVMGTNVSLPCGTTIFWNRQDVSSFRTVWNILLGGLIVYRLVIKVFKIIHDMKNPDNDKVEVMDL